MHQQRLLLLIVLVIVIAVIVYFVFGQSDNSNSVNSGNSGYKSGYGWRNNHHGWLKNTRSCGPIELHQCDFPLHIHHDGKYVLCEDVEIHCHNLITVDSKLNHVCIDLGCYTVNGMDKSEFAIFVENMAPVASKKVTVMRNDAPPVNPKKYHQMFGGSNGGKKGKKDDDGGKKKKFLYSNSEQKFRPKHKFCTSCKLHLKIKGGLVKGFKTGVYAAGIGSLDIKGTEFCGESNGQTAIKCTNSLSCSISNGSAYSYVSTLASVLHLSYLAYAKVNGFELIENSKEPVAPRTEENQSLVYLDSLDDFDMDDLRLLRNTFNMTLVEDRRPRWVNVSYCCQGRFSGGNISNNEDLSGDNGLVETAFATVFYCVYITSSENITFKDHKLIGNFWPMIFQAHNYFYSETTRNIEWENCQVNGNEVAEARFDYEDFAALGSYVGEGSNPQWKNCTSNDNKVIDGGPEKFSPRESNVWGFLPINFEAPAGKLINCEASNNVMGTDLPGHFVIPFIPVGTGVTFERCRANNNYGGYECWGFLNFFAFGTKYLECEANNNTVSGDEGQRAVGFDGGDPYTDEGETNNAEYINCIATGNTTAGIAIDAGETASADNYTIRGGIFRYNGYGILCRYVHAIQIEGAVCESNTYDGILLDGVANSRVHSCIAGDNGADGIRCTQASNGNTVRDCRVSANTGAGIRDESGNANGFLGNEAHNNGTDFVGLAAANISTYSKSTGIYSLGPTNISANTNISIIA